MRMLVLAFLSLTLPYGVASAEQKASPPAENSSTVVQTHTTDIFVDDMEQKLIERGKSCATKASIASTKTACRQEVWNIYSTRAMMKFTCLQAAAQAEQAMPNTLTEKLAQACREMVNGTDNFVHEVLGISRDSPVKSK